MPASRSLTVALILLLAPTLAEAAPRANAPAATSRERPGTPPKAAQRPTRTPETARTSVPTTSNPAPVPKASRTAPADRPVPKASHVRAPEPAARTVDPGTRTPRPAHDQGIRTPRTKQNDGIRAPRPAPDNGVRTPRPAQDNGRTSRPRADGIRTPAHDNSVRTPRHPQDDGVRTPRHPQDNGVRTPRHPHDPSSPAASETHQANQPGEARPRAAAPEGGRPAPVPAASPAPNKPRAPAPDATPAASPAPAKPRAPAPDATPAPVPEASSAPARPRAPAPDATPTPVPEASSAPAKPRAPAPDATPTPVPEASPRADTAAPVPVPEASPVPTRASDPDTASPAPVPEASTDPTPEPVPEASPVLAPTRAPAAPDASPVPPRSATPRPATTVPALTTKPTPAAPVPKASPSRPAKQTRLRPQREPLLARHPAASCELDPLEAVGLRQHERTRESLREFYWSDMARFFETTFDASEPTPRQADDPAFLPAADVIGTLPSTVRGQLHALATARTVDRLSGRSWTKIHKLLSSLGPADVAALLRADSPTLRAHVWTWLSTTKTGGCHLGHVDLDFLEAAVADRSIAVEHGDDLVYRSLGDYALEARARLATLDPARFDAFLTRLTAATEIDPLVRATAHGILLRRAHQDTLDRGLRDPSPPVRAATASAAAEMNRDKLEARLVEHAAGDPADLVTEQIVGALLGVHDPHNHGKPQLRGLLATTTDERLQAAVARWRGRGDALAPLPVPARPLRFAAAPVPTDSPDRPPADPVQRPSGASPAAAAAIHARDQEVRTRAPAPRDEPAPRVTPGVLDDDDDDRPIRIPPVRP